MRYFVLPRRPAGSEGLGEAELAALVTRDSMIGTGVPVSCRVSGRGDDRRCGSLAADGGAAAPPRSNGELVFEAPWESRSFGMAVALSEPGRSSGSASGRA